MLASPSAIPDESLGRLHSDSIDGVGAILAVLDAARRGGVWVESRLNLALEPQRARNVEVDADTVRLQLLLHLALDARLYFSSVARRFFDSEGARLEVGLRFVLFCTERRDHARRPPSTSRSAPTTRVELHAPGRAPARAEVQDLSAEGVPIRVPREGAVEVDARDCLNEAARPVDLEEQGVFHFWSAKAQPAMGSA